MRIYIGNLPYLTTEEELKSLFAKFGSVESAKIAIDGLMGRPLGFGFVKMNEDEQARQAIEALNSFQYLGSILVVNEARSREAGKGSKRRNGVGRSSGSGRR
jgi:RNA recognition motif-containing protein